MGDCGVDTVSGRRANPQPAVAQSWAKGGLAVIRAARLALLVGLLALGVPGGTTGCGGGCDLKIDTFVLEDGIVGQRYSQDLDADCGGDAWFLDSGDLPPGIALQSNGELEGMPVRAGVYDFTVAVVEFDRYGFTDEIAFGSFSITVR